MNTTFEIVETRPNIRFGRYCDAYKKSNKLADWQQATQAFDQANYIQSYIHFFNYLRDDSVKNVELSENQAGINFSFFQGSKHIMGFASHKHILASAKVAHCETLSVGFMRRLLDRNATLLYSSFSLDDNNDIVIRFTSLTSDCSPQKLYQALKELAIAADKEDDILIRDFSLLQALNNEHIKPLQSKQIALKYAFLNDNNKKVLAAAAALDPKRYAGGAAFLMLDWAYKIDYLIAPEGFTMDICDKVHHHYFNNSGFNNSGLNSSGGISLNERTSLMQRELLQLNQLSLQKLEAELYTTISTFGISKAADLTEIIPLIDIQLPAIQHFMLLRKHDVAEAIIGYVIGFCFFSYAVPKPVRRLFQLWYIVCESQYFKDLGLHYDFYDSTAKMFSTKNKVEILAEIDFLQAKYAASHPHFQFNKTALNFADLASFGYSLLAEIRNLRL
ncbi:MAG: hypothetical protein RI894_1718 [Bacteroidota bacterium]